jgi:hypothetical protein
MIVNPQLQQQNEDLYGNEIKRRRTNNAGNHLKVWRACQQPTFVLDEEKEEKGFKEEEEEECVYVVQEPIQVKEEEQAQEPQIQVVQAQVVQVQAQAEAPPLQFIGRIVVIETTGQRIHRGRIQSLFELNGERAIHIQTMNGEENLIFRVSQMHDLKMLHEDGDQDQDQEVLSPIPRREEDEEVVQIDDDDECMHEITQRMERMEVVQIDSDSESESDDDDRSTQAPEQEQDDDDFPDTQFQPARRAEEENEEEPNCCAICLDITDAARNFVSLDCGHQFHFACMMGNIASGGPNRNQCPMCRGDVVQQYDVVDLEYMEDMIERAAHSNQRLQDELNQTRQYREDLTAEYVRTMTMNMQIGMRHAEEREARDALERRAYICGLNERIATVVSSACNNDVRHQHSAAVHLERQIRELCMSFGMMAYDAQYDQAEYQAEYQDQQHQAEYQCQAEYQEEEMPEY